MGTVVRQAGAAAGFGNGSRLAFVTSTGTTLLVVPDSNQSSAPAGYGDRDDVKKIHIYESTTTARTAFTLRASINVAFNHESDVSACIDFLDNPHITYLDTAGAIKYVNFTYSSWTPSAITTVQSPAAGDSFQQPLISVSDARIPVVIWRVADAGRKGEFRVFVRRSSDNAWTQLVANVVEASGLTDTWESHAGTVLKGGTATARNYVAAFAVGGYGDGGVRIYTFTYDEGAGTASAATQRATYDAGNVQNSASYHFTRKVMLFQSAANEFTYASMQWFPGKCTVARATFDGTTFTQTVQPTVESFSHSRSADSLMTITYASQVVNFYTVETQSNSMQAIINYVRRINSNGSVSSSEKRYYDDKANWWHVKGLSGGNSWNLDNTYHDLIFYECQSNGTTWKVRHWNVKAKNAPAAVIPTDGSTVTTSLPGVSGKINWRTFNPSLVKMKWQFAKDSGFTTSVKTYTQADSKYRSGDGTPASIPITDVLPGADELTQGNWFVRAALVDEFGSPLVYSAANAVTVSHAPVAGSLSPANGSNLVYGSGQRTLAWKFSDTYSGDSQTAYEVVVTRDDTGAVVTDTGKVASTAQYYALTVDASLKGIELSWQVRLWDTDDVAGPYTSPYTFTLLDAPSPGVTDPTDGGTTASSLPKVTLTPSAPGRTITKLRVVYSQAGEQVYDTGLISVSIPDGQQYTWQGSAGVFKNNQSYTAVVTVTDNAGLSGSQTITFSTQWTPPADPTGLAVDATPYDDEAAGYVKVTWDNTAADADFVCWNIYRKDDEIDPNTLAVLAEGTWNLIDTLYEVADTYEYHDFKAPSSYKVNYRVRQVANRFGDLVESANTDAITGYPNSTYWLIEKDAAPAALKLHIVTEDSYTDEYEEEEYTLIGRGRHIDVGDHLGIKGSLTVQLRNTGSTSARQKRVALQAFKDGNTVAYMRNPFGDLYTVHVSNLEIGRIAGVGYQEFCDVTVPYSEVPE